MRLLEPLNGLKLAHGHWYIHAIFFIYLHTIDHEEVIREPLSEIEKQKAKLLEAAKSEGKASEHVESESIEDIVARENVIFQLLKWGHLLTLIGVFAQYVMKRRHHHFLS